MIGNSASDLQGPDIEQIKKDRASKAERRVLVGVGLGCALNLALLGSLTLFLLAGIGFVSFVVPKDIPWLVSSDGLSLIAFLGATSAYLVRYIHESLPLLADADVYTTAALMKVDKGQETRRMHRRIHDYTGAIAILIISFLIELASLVLKGD